MKRKIAITLLTALIGLAIAALYFSVVLEVFREIPTKDMDTFIVTPKEKEITVRNVTQEMIHYSIKPFNSGKDPMEKILMVGAIDLFPGNEAMKISFQRTGSTMAYNLYPGTPYSFRYNENNELELYEGSHGWPEVADLAPFVPTPMVVVEKMLELADVDRNDVVFDLGCGDGRIVIMAAENYSARGVGIDLDPQRIRESEDGAREAGVERLVEFRQQDVMKADFSEATVVTLYLLTESNRVLRPLLEEQLKPGVYVVSHNYRIPGWEEKQIEFVSLMDEDGEKHDIYLYRM